MLITGQSNCTILQDFHCRSSLVAQTTAMRVLDVTQISQRHSVQLILGRLQSNFLSVSLYLIIMQLVIRHAK